MSRYPASVCEPRSLVVVPFGENLRQSSQSQTWHAVFAHMSSLTSINSIDESQELNSTADMRSNTSGQASLQFCTLSVVDTISTLDTDGNDGLLDESEVEKRRSVHGSNELQVRKKRNLVKDFFMCFVEDRLILLLIGSAAISFFMGSLDDGISITIAVCIVVTVGFIQEYKSEKSLESLNELVPAQCHLIRSGLEANKLASDLVPGDLVKFKTGDKIPADLRIIEAVDLTVDESTLTGETEPVTKFVEPVSISDGADDIPFSERNNIAYMGTLVKSGHGRGIVIGTGRNSSFGSIFELMENTEKPRTPLQTTMDKLGNDLTMVSFGIITLIFLIGIIQGRKWLEMFQIAVSLAVAAIPEGLPIIVTVTLALGVLRMAGKKAVIRRLPSVETLGAVNVICTDKTGTLTTNHMTAVQMLHFDDTIDINSELVRLDNRELEFNSENAGKLLQIGNLCNNAAFSEEEGTFFGNPTDVALMELIEKVKSIDARQEFIKLAELPFNSKRKFMAFKYVDKVGQNCQVYAKGAYERILQRSKYFLTNSNIPQELTEDDRQALVEISHKFTSQGLRLLAFGYSNCEDATDRLSDEEVNGLTLVGFIGLQDPTRPLVKEAIQQFHESGVQVIMITGDSPNTATSIAEQVGIPVENVNVSVMTGDILDTMTEDQLADVIDNVSVFSRTTPEHKLAIVKALQKKGNVVAMTGDGVNDAPALKLSDIGISMGESGTDVAKEASDMVLLDDDFATILTAIKEGKGIFLNIQNFLTFQLSTSIATLSLVIIASILKLPIPLNPMQILWINILMDGPPAQSLGMNPVDEDIMKKPPRHRDDNILSFALIRRMIYCALCMVIGTTFIFMKSLEEDKKLTPKGMSMTFTCFVFFDLFNALACRHSVKSVFQVGLFTNKMFNIAILLSLAGQFLVIYLPFLQAVFKTAPLNLKELALLFGISSSVLIIDEVRKLWNRWRDSRAVEYSMV